MRLLGVLLLGVFVVGCGDQKPVSFREDVQPILQKKCVSCHNEANAAGKIVLTSYDAVMKARTHKGKKPLVVVGNVPESWLYILAGTDQPHFRMPPDTSKITPLPTEELQALSKWIVQGAKNN
jgi:predicted CXXCH cytochrome family protein